MEERWEWEGRRFIGYNKCFQYPPCEVRQNSNSTTSDDKWTRKYLPRSAPSLMLGNASECRSFLRNLAEVAGNVRTSSQLYWSVKRNSKAFYEQTSVNWIPNRERWPSSSRKKFVAESRSASIWVASKPIVWLPADSRVTSAWPTVR